MRPSRCTLILLVVLSGCSGKKPLLFVMMNDTNEADEVGDWLRRAMSAIPAERFVDAAAMQTAWRGAVRVVLDREQEMPWWRRFFSSDPETDKD